MVLLPYTRTRDRAATASRNEPPDVKSTPHVESPADGSINYTKARASSPGTSRTWLLRTNTSAHTFWPPLRVLPSRTRVQPPERRRLKRRQRRRSLFCQHKPRVRAVVLLPYTRTRDRAATASRNEPPDVKSTPHVESPADGSINYTKARASSPGTSRTWLLRTNTSAHTFWPPLRVLPSRTRVQPPERRRLKRRQRRRAMSNLGSNTRFYTSFVLPLRPRRHGPRTIHAGVDVG